MTVRNFNNVTTVGTLTGPVASSATTLGVQNFSNLPTAPFTITVDRNTPTEEICLVTAVAGGTLTVTRGYDGSAAVAHSAGAAVEHTAGAIEYIEANAHVNATANVHGVSGGLVGTDGAQSLFAKTLVSPVVQADPVAGDAVVAWVPPAAPTRNLFRGMNTAGADVVTVDAAGNANVHNVHATGTGQVDGVLTAAGGVTVPAGKTVAANGGITTTTVNATGNVTVGGSETVTGTQTTTGAITGGSVTTLGPLGLSQLASDAAGTAGQDVVYAKTDGGIYRRAGTGAVARVPVHWGSGTTAPTTGVLAGDRFQHTQFGPMTYSGTVWRPDSPLHGISTPTPSTGFIGSGAKQTFTTPAINVPPSTRIRAKANFRAISFNSNFQTISLSNFTVSAGATIVAQELGYFRMDQAASDATGFTVQGEVLIDTGSLASLVVTFDALAGSGNNSWNLDAPQFWYTIGTAAP